MITEEERRNLLHHYMLTEPQIRYNLELFDVSVSFGQWYVVFYATCVRHHRVGAMALVTMDTWQKINQGLPMAAVYNCVLESLEDSLAFGYDVGDIIDLEKSVW